MASAESGLSRGRLFLTGATGHTGSRVARRLLEDGWALSCLNHNPEHRRRLPGHERLRVVAGDVREPQGWIDELHGAAALVHMAHIGFAPHVIDACERAGVRRVLAMSSTRRFTRFPEATARLVIDGEAAFEASALDYTILRATMIFGGRRDNNLEKVVAWLRRRRMVPIVGGGRNLVQPIFVEDLVDALLRALARPETARRILTVAGPEPMTQRAMLHAIGEALGRRPILLPVPFAAMFTGAWLLERLPGRPPLTRDQVRRQLEDKTADIAEARAALGGWTPTPFSEAIRRKVADELGD